MENSPNGRQLTGELSSWKEVAAFLHVSVRTAQNWESEKGLPVHRIPGSSGRVRADPAELARWKERSEKNQPWWAHANVRGYYAYLLPLLLVSMLIHDLLSHHSTRLRVPSAYRIEWNELVILDASGTELWRKTFPSPLARGSASGQDALYPPVAFLDVNQDGVREVVFVQTPADFAQEIVFCYLPTGRELWRFPPQPPVGGALDLQRTVMNVRLLHSSDADSGRNQRAALFLVVTCSTPTHHGRLHLLDGKGTSVELFKQEGHLDHLGVADVDADGMDEIVVGGFDAERQQPVLHLLNLSRGNQPANVMASIWFPRTTRNRGLADELRISRLTVANGVLRVSTHESTDQGRHEVCYTFDKHLQARASFCDRWPPVRESDVGALVQALQVLRPSPVTAAPDQKP